MAAGGVDRDILIPYNIIGAQKLARLVALARDTRLTVAADSEYTVQGLAAAASEANVTVGVGRRTRPRPHGRRFARGCCGPRRKNRSGPKHRTPGHHVHASDTRHATAHPRDARAFRPQGPAASHRQRRQHAGRIYGARDSRTNRVPSRRVPQSAASAISAGEPTASNNVQVGYL